MDITTIARQARVEALRQAVEEELAVQLGGGLLSPAQVQQRAAQEAHEALEDFGARTAQGLLLLLDQYSKLKGAPGHESPIAFLEPGFFTGKEEALERAAQEDDEDVHLAEAWGISLDDLSAAHDLAAELFDHERYEDASAALSCLLTLAPDVAEIALSLGHAEYHCGRVESAIRCYAMSYVCDPSSPRPMLHAAFCSDKLGNKDEAREYLDSAEEANRSAGLDDVARDIQQLRASI